MEAEAPTPDRQAVEVEEPCRAAADSTPGQLTSEGDGQRRRFDREIAGRASEEPLADVWDADAETLRREAARHAEEARRRRLESPGAREGAAPAVEQRCMDEDVAMHAMPRRKQGEAASTHRADAEAAVVPPMSRLEGAGVQEEDGWPCRREDVDLPLDGACVQAGRLGPDEESAGEGQPVEESAAPQSSPSGVEARRHDVARQKKEGRWSRLAAAVEATGSATRRAESAAGDSLADAARQEREPQMAEASERQGGAAVALDRVSAARHEEPLPQAPSAQAPSAPADDDYSGLSLKQLLRIVGQRGIDVSSCVEKEDILQRLREGGTPTAVASGGSSWPTTPAERTRPQVAKAPVGKIREPPRAPAPQVSTTTSCLQRPSPKAAEPPPPPPPPRGDMERSPSVSLRWSSRVRTFFDRYPGFVAILPPEACGASGSLSAQRVSRGGCQVFPELAHQRPLSLVFVWHGPQSLESGRARTRCVRGGPCVELDMHMLKWPAAFQPSEALRRVGRSHAQVARRISAPSV